MRAVLADDDELFRLAMSALLKGRCGFVEVVETASLDDAMAVLGSSDANAPIDIALLDLEMPGMSGATCVSAVRECFPSLKVAVCTASMRRRDVLQALEAGAHGYISKGLGIKELAEAVDLICRDIIYVPQWLADAPSSVMPSALLPDDCPGEAPSPARHGPAPASPHLTARQTEVLRLIVAGKTNKEVARALSLGEGTIKIHVTALLRAFRAGTRSGVASAGALLLGTEASLGSVTEPPKAP